MTDWTPAARWWLRGVCAAGLLAVLIAVHGLPGEIAAGDDVAWGGLLVLCVALGLLRFEIPGNRTFITPSETVAFLAVLLYGPSVAALAGAAEGYLSVRRVRRSHLYSALFSAGTMALSLYAAGLVYRLAGGLALAAGIPEDAPVVAPVLAMACVHYLLNTGTVTIMVRLRRPDVRSLASYWRAEYGFAAVTYVASAWLAVLLVLAGERFGWSALIGAVPLLAGLMYLMQVHTGRRFDELRHRDELGIAYRRALMTLAQAIDARDEHGHGHVFRVQDMALRLADRLDLEPQQRESLSAAALLHDIGKLAVPDTLVNKQASLTETEAELMRAHPSVGADLLNGVAFPEPLLPSVRHHHEAWNGSGYPDGLTGNEIPLGARILAVVDEYDRLRCSGPFRSGLSPREALEVLGDEAGRKLDPGLVRLFASCVADIECARPASQEWNDWRPGAECSRAFSDIVAARRASGRLMDAMQELGNSLDLDETLSLVARHVRRLAPGLAGGLYLARRDGERAVAVDTWGTGSDVLAGSVVEAHRGLAGHALTTRATVKGRMTAEDGVETAKEFFGAAIPLVHRDGEVEGVVVLLCSRSMAIDETPVRSVALMASKAADAVRNARRFDELRGIAPLDDGGVDGNPDSTLARLRAELILCRERVVPMAVIVLKLRGLNDIEQRSGTAVARRVVNEVHALLRRLLSANDWMGLGPENCTVIARVGADRRDVDTFVARIDEEVAALRCVTPRGRVLRVDPGLGRAHYPEDGADGDVLLARALSDAAAAPLHAPDSGAVVNLKTIA